MAKSSSGLQTALDTYTYWSVPKSVYVTLTILNNGVDVGFGTTIGAGGPEAANYGPSDEYLTPGTLIRPEIFDAVRIKNHVAGQAAQYNLVTRLKADVPADVPLGASFTPTYLTVNPDGTIGANFTGHIKASGVDLPEAVSTSYVSSSALDWLDSNGVLREFIQGLITGQNHRLISVSQPDANNQSILQVQANAGGNPGSSLVSASAKAAGGASKSVIILDDRGFSSFLKVVGNLNDLSIQAGQNSFTTTASGWQTFTILFPQAFIALTSLICTIETDTGAGIISSETRNVSTSGFLLDVNTPTIQHIKAHWIAIGD